MSSQEFRKQQPSTQDIKQFSVPEINEINVEGKQRFYVHHTPELGVLKIMLWFPCGTYHQNKSFQATAAFDLILSGGNGKSEKDIIGYIDHLGASVTTDTDMYTSSLTIKCSKLNALETFQWVLNAIETAEYPEMEFENYKLVKYAGFERKMQTPSFWSSRLAYQNYYGIDSPLGKYGELSDIQNLNRDEVVNFSKNFIHPSDAMLLIAGDCDESLKNSILNIHNKKGSKLFNYPDTTYNTNIQSTFSKIIKHNLPNSSQVSMVMLKHIGAMPEEKLHAYSLLNMILGGYFGSRLMQEIREEKGLTYGIGSYFRPAYDGRSWIISGEMNSENAALAFDNIKEILSELQKTKISTSELDKAKRYYSGQFRSGFDGPFSLAGKIQQKIQRNLSNNFFNETLSNIWNVTPEQLLELAENELNPSSFIVTMAGKLE